MDELVLEELAAFFCRFFKKHVIMVTRSTITTTARQPTRINTDLDSVVSLASSSEFELTGSKKQNGLIILRILLDDLNFFIYI